MQSFILGHVILLAICMNMAINLLNDDEVSIASSDYFVALILQTVVLYIPLEVMYWVLHFNFVP